MRQFSGDIIAAYDFRAVPCVNPYCGKRTELYREKICPGCGKRSVERADQKICGDCGSELQNGDPVCPLCGTKQRTTVELRSLGAEKNFAAHAGLLHRAQGSLSLAECKQRCRTITAENPYRLSFAGKPEQIRPFIREWNALGGTAAACFAWETSRRPVVLVRSWNRLRGMEHIRLLLRAVRQSDRSGLTFGETAEILHGIRRDGKPYRLCFTSGFDRIDAWVAAWRRLGGTAVRSQEHW